MAQDDPYLFYSDEVGPIRRSSPDEFFLITIEARPTPESDEHGEAGGAFVNCWVDADDLRTAERRAVELIRDGGWQPDRFDDWDPVTRATADERDAAEGGPSPRDLIEQAAINGIACVFHTWPVDAPDADEAA